jgi:hypothetical protein
MRQLRSPLLAVTLLTGSPGTALAGMPTVTLTDAARMRVQAISFFLVGLLVSAWLIRLLWNYLGRDFAFLPRLSYGKAVGVVVLWGLLFVLVLTMISGARELLTPGAWKKEGLTYRLNEEPLPPPDDAATAARRHRLEALRTALWKYVAAHEGQYPSDLNSTGIPEEDLQVPDGSGMRYLYAGKPDPRRGSRPLVYEPEVFGKRRLVLFTDGAIRALDLDSIHQAQEQGGR